MLKSDVRSRDLDMVNGLPGSLGALSNLTPDGEYNFEKEYVFYEYQERNQTLLLTVWKTSNRVWQHCRTRFAEQWTSGNRAENPKDRF